MINRLIRRLCGDNRITQDDLDLAFGVLIKSAIQNAPNNWRNTKYTHTITKGHFADGPVGDWEITVTPMGPRP